MGPVPVDQVEVGPAYYEPLFPTSSFDARIEMRPFRIDREPVTERQFLAFVKVHPEWRRDRVPPVRAELGYLSHWATPTTLGPGVNADAPVTHVSWFAARAYCEDQGRRLPTEAEWELVAAADADSLDARRDPAFVDSLLAWYAEPTPATLASVGGEPNAWGVSDLHGLVWEWVEDFNSSMVTDDARGPGGRFCGGGALSASDASDYAGFLRYAFRSSLEANYTTANLGFRCAD